MYLLANALGSKVAAFPRDALLDGLPIFGERSSFVFWKIGLSQLSPSLVQGGMITDG
jgi:hypothetical protein